MTSSNGPEPVNRELPAQRPACVPITKVVGPGRKFVIGSFGVGLPLIALCCEMSWRMCGDMLLDPLPTPLHACLIALVIAVNAALLFGAGQRWPWWGRVASGVTLTTSTVYSIIFLPVTPIGLVGVLLYGLGLLALSPALSLVAGLLARSLLAPLGVQRKGLLRYPSLLGSGAALVLFALPMIRPLVTYVYVNKATSNDPSRVAAALTALRRAGSEQILLDSCLPNFGSQEGSPLTLSFLLHGLPPGTVAGTYYRVTGLACNRLPTSSTAGPFDRGWHLTASADEPEGPSKHAELKLASSRIDATIDAPAALGYLEWTWVVHNTLTVQREGVAEIALPPGAVVSRATLWIGNEPREAAFAERHQTQAAYDKVVSRRRDPLLVMRTPEGTVQLKFFPVPAEGDLKLRIGITTPLQVISAERATLGLPGIRYRNFALVDAHRLWVEAKTPFAYHATQAPLEAGLYRLDRPLPAGDLQKPGAFLEFTLSGLPAQHWARDPVQTGRFITQRVRAVTQAAPSSVSLVVDGSRGQTESLSAVGAALAALPDAMRISITLAGDQPEVLLPWTLLDRATAARMTQRFRELTTHVVRITARCSRGH